MSEKFECPQCKAPLPFGQLTDECPQCRARFGYSSALRPALVVEEPALPSLPPALSSSPDDPAQTASSTKPLIFLGVLVTAALVAGSIRNTSSVGLLVLVALTAGVVLEPLRIFQVFTGRLREQHPTQGSWVRKSSVAFILALPFWLAMPWAFWNMYIEKSCNGDTCIGYGLLVLPFPFLYGIGEMCLAAAKTTHSKGAPPKA